MEWTVQEGAKARAEVPLPGGRYLELEVYAARTGLDTQTQAYVTLRGNKGGYLTPVLTGVTLEELVLFTDAFAVTAREAKGAAARALQQWAAERKRGESSDADL